VSDPGFNLNLQTGKDRPKGRPFLFLCPDCGSLNGGNIRTAGEGKTNPAGWFSMSALCARKYCASADALLFLFWLIFPRGRSGKSKGEFRSLRRAAQGAALRTRSLSRKAGESFSKGAVQRIFKLYRSSIVFSREI